MSLDLEPSTPLTVFDNSIAQAPQHLSIRYNYENKVRGAGELQYDRIAYR